MRVLYGLWNYPQISETYIATEISYVQKHGVEVEVWAQEPRSTGIARCKVHRGMIQEAIADFKPDLVHFHYLNVGYLNGGKVKGLPVTVRGHSFDWSPQAMAYLEAMDNVKRIFLFPHFAARIRSAKTIDLPVAYDASLYRPVKDKAIQEVIRTGAGLPSKGFADFFSVADLCPRHSFRLIVAESGSQASFIDLLKGRAPARVQVHVNVPPEETAVLTGRAGICLETHDVHSQPFGMPVSVVEAMATGSLVLVRDNPDARSYVEDGALVYADVGQAADLIKGSYAWPGYRWEEQAAMAIDRARLFKDTEVLGRLVEEWKQIVG